jgi:NADPH:quinone reductase-like Zn-dependent oxidoreductase
VPEPGPGEVLIRVHAVGVNGWDVRARAGLTPAIPGRPGMSLPFQPGREAAGVIAAVGEGVQAFKPGDRAAVMPSPSCGRCHYCAKRATNLCIARELPGHSAPGTSAEYVVAAADAVLPVPDTVDDIQASTILWAYGTALHMVRVGDIRVGDAVVVTAASSAMGIACIQVARLAGAGLVIGLTRSPAKHQAILDSGADAVFDHQDPETANKIRGMARAIGADLVLDNYGSQELITFGTDVLDLGGRLVMIASDLNSIDGTMGYSPFRMVGKEISMRGSRGQTRWEQEAVMQMAARKQISMPVAEVLPLSDIQLGHELQEKAAHVGKIVLTL